MYSTIGHGWHGFLVFNLNKLVVFYLEMKVVYSILYYEVIKASIVCCGADNVMLCCHYYLSIYPVDRLLVNIIH